MKRILIIFIRVYRREDAASPIVVFAETSVKAGDARAHTTKLPPMGDSMKSVSDQLLQTSTSTNLVVSTEIRTAQKNDTPLKGEAVPVLTDDDVHAVGPYSYKISSDGSTRPTGDLSTWILLGGESSPSPLNMATIKKVPKPADATVSTFVQSYETTSSTTRKRKPTTERMSTTHSPVTESSIKLQDSKFKNKTPVIVGKIPTTTTVKIEETTTSLPELPPLDNNTRFGTPVVTFPHVPPRQRPSANNTKKPEKPEKPLTTKITSTAVVISKPLNSTIPVTTTLAPTVTNSSSSTTITVQNSTEVTQVITDSDNSTVKSTSLKKKKKKKNKNKRRPIKTSNDDPQSKIDDQSTKITTLGRPLSTRIYNYLAREVMPNVGVGLVGLVLTAGLAGLLLYSPLGGAAIPMIPLRRTDSHALVHSNVHSAGYVPHETDNSQPEEQVFGQVLSGMSYGHNPYGRERPDVVPKYKPSYQPSEYPAAHDTPKYNAHDTTKFSTNDATKYTAPDTTKYATHDGTKYAVVESTKYSAPDTNKYSEPDTSKYSTIDANDPQEKVYPSLDTPQEPTFEESQDSQDQTYQNHHYDQLKFDSSNAYEQPKYQSNSQSKGTYQEDQTSFDSPKYPGYVQDVPKEDAVVVNYNFDNHRTDEKESSTTSSADPTFSALQGVPKFYNPSINPEQISVNVHQTVKMEHGPRSLRIRRQVDELNEVDAQLPDETTPKSSEETDVKTTEYSVNSDTTTSTTTTTTTTAKTTLSSESPPVNHNQFSLVDFIRRVAEVKLKMGIEILRNTAASFTHYVNAIQRRMTHMVRSLQKSNDRQHSEDKQEQDGKSESTTAHEEKRQRRSIRHRMYSN